MIHIALASNAAYFDGLAVSVLSVLRSDAGEELGFHILDGGLTAAQKAFLSRRVHRHGPRNEIRFHRLDVSVFDGLLRDYGGSYMTYARILIGSLLGLPKVIYLDTDLLVASSLRPLWDLENGDWIVAASPDPGIAYVDEDYPLGEVTERNRYFNAGVLVINLDRWRSEGIGQQLLAMLTERPERFRWWDQTAMNVLLRGRVLFLSADWNTFADRLDLTAPQKGAIFHYVGSAKPWNKYSDAAEFCVWRAFYAKYVRSRVHLLRDRRLRASIPGVVRHRVFRRNTMLRRAAVQTTRVLTRLGRVADERRLQRLLTYEHEHAPAPVCGVGAAVQAYVRARWS